MSTLVRLFAFGFGWGFPDNFDVQEYQGSVHVQN